MKLKIKDDGTPAMSNGLPIYIYDDGREAPFDAAASVKRNGELEAALDNEKIGAHFDRSKFVAEKLALPADIVRAGFRDAFKLEGNKIVGFDKTGNKIYSRRSPGNVADFDEALELLIDAYPNRDSILRKAAGPDNGRGTGTGANGVLSRSAFEALDAGARMAHIRAGGRLVDA